MPAVAFDGIYAQSTVNQQLMAENNNKIEFLGNFHKPANFLSVLDKTKDFKDGARLRIRLHMFPVTDGCLEWSPSDR